MKKFITAIVILITLGVLGYLLMPKLFQDKSVEVPNSENNPNSSNPTDSTKTSEITSFGVEKPNFVVYGKNLSKVEIWGVPSGTGVGEDSYYMLAEAKIENESSVSQKWVAKIPSEPQLLTSVFVKGTSTSGESLFKDLNVSGASEINALLWGSLNTSNSQTLQIKVGESKQAFGVNIKALNVFEDSRCPKDVTCIWAGQVGLEIEVSSGATKKNLKLYSNGSAVNFENKVSIKLTGVSPVAVSGSEIQQGDYIITLEVSKL